MYEQYCWLLTMLVFGGSSLPLLAPCVSPSSASLHLVSYHGFTTVVGCLPVFCEGRALILLVYNTTIYAFSACVGLGLSRESISSDQPFYTSTSCELTALLVNKALVTRYLLDLMAIYLAFFSTVLLIRCAFPGQ